MPSVVLSSNSFANEPMTQRRVGSGVAIHTNTASSFAYVLVTKKTPTFCNRGPQFFT